MFCNHCGNQMEEGMKFCAKCGSPVQQVGAAFDPAPRPSIPSTPPSSAGRAGAAPTPRIPSMDEVKAKVPSMDEMKAKMPSMDSVRSAMPSIPSVPGMGNRASTSTAGHVDYAANLKYFSTYGIIKRIIQVLLITFGVMFLLAGIYGDSTSLAIGLLLAGVGGIWMYSTWNGMSDAEYDRIVQAQVADMKQRALAKLGVDESEVNEIEPISFGGYEFKTGDFFKRGRDGQWRTNEYAQTMLLFSKEEVHVYAYRFCTTENRASESTDVIFYRDVVSASTTSEAVPVPVSSRSGNGGGQAHYEAFKLRTSGGDALDISITDDARVQESIHALRQLLRLKKSSLS